MSKKNVRYLSFKHLNQQIEVTEENIHRKMSSMSVDPQVWICYKFIQTSVNVRWDIVKAKFGPLAREQPHSPDVHHCIITKSTHC